MTNQIRYSIGDALNIRKAAVPILIEARLRAMAKVRDDAVAAVGASTEELARAVPAWPAGVEAPTADQLASLRDHYSASTANLMAAEQLADGITVGGIAELVGIDLEEFAKEAWQGFEDTFTAIMEGGQRNV